MAKKSITIKSMYYGFPVIIVSTVNPVNGARNIAPLSASFSLGDKLYIATSIKNKTSDNIIAGSDVVVNVPDFTLWQKVEQLGRTTGRRIVPKTKSTQGVEYCEDKFSLTGLTYEPSECISPPRITECPVQAECRVTEIIPRGAFIIVELDIVKTWVDERLLNDEGTIIHTGTWFPLIYKFREYDTTTSPLGFNFKHEK
ncbi:flavin reductase family protein [Salmonella enterica subsp. enterica serovar Saintpaul]|nr:flavin reductase family protein [Salmonella enterica subsp. enterica serovar Saintpaul]